MHKNELRILLEHLYCHSFQGPEEMLEVVTPNFVPKVATPLAHLRLIISEADLQYYTHI
jgi:hypothetical protein